MLPSPKRDGLGGNITIGVIIFLNHRDRLFCNVETPNKNNDYFTIITIIGPTTNRSDASPKSMLRTDRALKGSVL